MARIFLIFLSLALIGSAFSGLLVDSKMHRNEPESGWLSPFLGKISGDSVAVFIGLLSKEKSRRLFSHGARRAVSFIATKLVQYGWDVELENYEIKNPGGSHVTLTNIIGDPHGRNDSDSLLILCTHYDSRGEGWNERAPGADDNASGAAVLLEVARVMGQLPPGHNAVGLELVFFGGEEDSFIGSSAFVGRFLHERKKKRLIGAINVDMVGYDKFGPRDFVVFSDNNSAGFAKIVENCSNLYTQLRCETTITSAADSDHHSFWRKGVKAVSIWEGYDHNPYYHGALDTVDRLSPVFMEEITKVIVCSVWKCTRPNRKQADSLGKGPARGRIVEKKAGTISQEKLPGNLKLIPSSK